MLAQHHGSSPGRPLAAARLVPSPDALQAGCDRSKKETAAAAMAVAHHSLEIRHPVSAKTLAAATILKRVSVISFLQP